MNAQMVLNAAENFQRQWNTMTYKTTWQPHETAPIDGSEFLVFERNQHSVVRYKGEKFITSYGFEVVFDKWKPI